MTSPCITVCAIKASQQEEINNEKVSNQRWTEIQSQPLLFPSSFFKGGNTFKLKRELNHLSVTLTSFGNSYHTLTGPKAALLFELIHRQPHELEKRSLEEQRVWQRAALLNLCSQLNPKLEQLSPCLLLQAAIALLFIGQQGGMFSPDGFFGSS